MLIAGWPEPAGRSLGMLAAKHSWCTFLGHCSPWSPSSIDLALLANILLLIALSGYDSFVSRLNTSEQNVTALDALDGLTLAKVKLKLLGSMIIISAIGLLSTFLSVEAGTAGGDQAAYLQIAIHLVLAVSAVLLAYSDKLDKS